MILEELGFLYLWSLIVCLEFFTSVKYCGNNTGGAKLSVIPDIQQVASGIFVWYFRKKGEHLVQPLSELIEFEKSNTVFIQKMCTFYNFQC